MVDGGWNSIDAFIVNKVHVFIFSLYLPGLDRENNYPVAENIAAFFVNTVVKFKTKDKTKNNSL